MRCPYGNDGSDIAASLRVAVTGQARAIDVGTVNGVYFVNVASGGFGAMITATTPQDIKRRLGGLAYTLSALARLSELNPTVARVAVDEYEAMSINISALVIANNRFAGGGFDVAPAADVADGLLDLGVISNKGLFSEPGRIAKALNPKDPLGGLVERTQFHTAIIETETSFHLNLDGEPMLGKRFEVRVHPSRLNFVSPPSTT